MRIEKFTLTVKRWPGRMEIVFPVRAFSNASRRQMANTIRRAFVLEREIQTAWGLAITIPLEPPEDHG